MAFQPQDDQAFRELNQLGIPRGESCSTVADSRPPSYNTVSIGSQLAHESAQRARAIQNAATDYKSIVSSGDRESVDVTERKQFLSAREEGRSRNADYDERDDDDDDEQSFYADAQTDDPNLSDILQIVRELQRQQEHLIAMHEDHDKKLEDLIRHKPVVNEKLQVIRKNSVRRLNENNNSRGATITTTTTTTNSNKNTYRNVGNNKTNTNNPRSRDGLEETRQLAVCAAQSSDEERQYANRRDAIHNPSTPSNDQVVPRKPSTSASRNESRPILDAFRKRLISDEQQNLYIQLERLYSNVHLLHLPSKTVQRLMEGSFAYATAGMTQAAPNRASLGVTELVEENAELKRKNSELQEELEKLRQEREAAAFDSRRIPPPLPPKPKQDIRPPIFGAASRGRPRWRAEREKQKPNTNKNLQAPSSNSPKHRFVAGRPTSPFQRPLCPPDIEIREIVVQHKIESYFQKLNEEKMSEGSKQVSSPFYTTLGGCRVQLEVFLNGNGTGFNRRMSLFIRVIPGDYDNFIKWPIKLHIRATLMNQNRGISQSVEDSGNEFKFSRPTGSSDTESDCWGLVEFVSHSMINQPGFIKDDAILLRCKISLMP
ncbi:tnf receptor-associated factor 4 [Plakobranchus ocellatus]|uniref:Tnf receptor-associated factor 4 n=1 Tax=Plakobranchus ocellatus TaxID=259542 RepID=A0AAV4APJ8_9GAST|nr:tnf receptor-associated factor 4 [Plakobranchus ocellatus]